MIKRISTSNKIFRRVLYTLAFCLLFSALFSESGQMRAIAESAPVMSNAYNTYSLGPDWTFVRTQPAYNASALVLINEGECLDMVESEGKLFITVTYSETVQQGGVYSAESGSSIRAGAVLITDYSGNLVRKIDNALLGDYYLAEPSGVYVRDSVIYVADKSKKHIVIIEFSDSDTVLGIPSVRTIQRPDSALFGKTMPFVPTKIIVDAGMNIVVTGEGNPNGAIHLSISGEFIGYVGINKTKMTFGLWLKQLFFSKEQKARLLKRTPPSPDTLCLSDEGLIYTVTKNASDGSIKKLDTAGTTIMTTGSGMFSDTVCADIDSEGFVFAAESGGFITIYDPDGYVIFTFGGKDPLERMGAISDPAAISILPDNTLCVLDRAYGSVVFYSPTEFYEKVITAVSLYCSGYYKESEPYWTEICDLNGGFILAYLGLADANYQKGNYSLALEQYKLSESKSGYSEAFWYIRNSWMQNNAIWIILVIILLAAVLVALKQVNKRTTLLVPVTGFFDKIKRNKIVSQLLYSLYYIRHPQRAIEQMKYKNKLTVLPATIMYLIFTGVQIAAIFLTGFLFRSYNNYNVDLFREILMAVLPIILIVACNFFMSTISGGEGKFKHVYIAAIYCMTPYILLQPLVIILTRVLTYNETIILSVLNIVIYAYVAFLAIISVSKVHFFKSKSTFTNIVMTLFTLVMTIFFAIILYLLASQLIGFISDIIKELML